MASGKVRLFVALDPPAGARARIASWADVAFGADERLRLVAPEALHVTLAFLGWRPEGEVDASIAALSALELPGARLVPVRLHALPPRRPRLFALGLEDPGGGARTLQAAVAEALRAAGVYEPEERAFWAHVTVARVRRGERIRRPSAPAPPPPFTARELRLYRSHTGREGARYEPLWERSLASA